MDTQFHPMTELFTQLGLRSSSDEIEAFFLQNKLQRTDSMLEASFFSDEQKQFLREALAEDSDWAEIVDQMDVRLRD